MNEEQETDSTLEDQAKEQARERSRMEKEEAELRSWARFMQSERSELELRKEGQLADLLGGARSELPPQLRDLASEDRRQAEEGLVALMSGGELSYKHLEDLTQADRPARTAANRLRATWLKERLDGWLVHNDNQA